MYMYIYLINKGFVTIGKKDHCKLALFHWHYSVAAIKSWFKVVSSSENTDLSTVAMAIAGYTEEKNTLWRKTCMSLLQKLEDPYLRAMFAFLTCDRENYEEILVSLGAFIVYFTVIIYRYQACYNRGVFLFGYTAYKHRIVPVPKQT